MFEQFEHGLAFVNPFSVSVDGSYTFNCKRNFRPFEILQGSQGQDIYYHYNMIFSTTGHDFKIKWSF